MNYQAEWWAKAYARIKSSTILTKSEERKILLQRIKDLEQGKKGQAYLKLQQEKANYKKQAKDTQQELEDLQADYHNLENKEQLIRYQKDSLEKDYQDLALEKKNIVDTANLRIKELEAEKEAIRNSFTNGSAIGTTHWIYWKNLTEQAELERDQALADLSQERDRVNKLGDNLMKITDELTQKDELITNLKKELSSAKKAVDLKAMEIIDLTKYLTKYKNAKDNQISHLKNFFTELLTAINSANFLSGKSKIKKVVNQIEHLMDWEASPIDEEPEERLPLGALPSEENPKK